MSAAAPWWKRAVFYQIYPRSFADGNGDGVGDLPGIVARLDHLVDLGVDAVWLSPFYESPMRDFGYDISDHCAVDPVFGTLDDIDAVIAGCHDRGLRIIVDFVPNHVSSDHPWFVEARSSTDSATRDWFIWADPGPDGAPPTNWTASFTEESAWEFDDASGQYYLHLFLPSQPDVNWADPDLEAAQHDVLRFWLDRGVDGFRMDVLNAIGKDPSPRDVPERLAGLPHVVLTHHETAMPLIRRIRETVDAAGDTFVIGEIVTFDLDTQASYQIDGAGVHAAVNFASTSAPWNAEAWRTLLTDTEAAYPFGGPTWPSYVLSNHDVVRHRSRFGGSAARARAACLLLLTVRGVPFLYAGEELGLRDADVPADRVVDPGGRDGCRSPIPWTAEPGHGWGGDAWLPFAPEAATDPVSVQRDDAASMLALYRTVLGARRATPSLQVGALELLDAPDDVLSFVRRAVPDHAHDHAHDGEGAGASDAGDRTVHVNFGEAPAAVAAGGTVVVSSDPTMTPGSPFLGTVPGDVAVVVAP